MGEQTQRQETTQKTEQTSIMRQIAEKEEKIKSQKHKQETYKKRMNQIESSNTWKVGNLLSPIKKGWDRLFKRSAEQEEEISRLQKVINAQNERIDELEATLRPLQFLDENLTTHSITQRVRTLKDEGILLENLQTMIQQKIRITENYREALLYAARLYMNADQEVRDAVYNEIFAGLSIDEIPEFMIRAGLDESPISLRHTSSFRACLSQRMRQSQLVGTLPEWFLDDKRTAYQFVKQFDLKVPQLDERIYTVDSIPNQEGIVIKPVDAAGARGVYLMHNENLIFDVRNARDLTSFAALKEAMQQDLQSGAVDADEWLIEQLIYENKKQLLPARDIKFYSFYGKVGLILEIVRDPEIRHAWWTRDGRRIDTGKYEATLFTGQGVSQEEIDKVEHLSKAIPAPFMRIDFLQSEDGLVFGEFTPKPGNYDDFDLKTDQLLGDYYIEAEARLIKDLLKGKTFPEYEQFVQSLKKEKREPKINA